MSRVFTLAALNVVVACACAAPRRAPALMRDVRELADPRYAGRAAGTEGDRRAVAYVAGRLRAIGLEPVEQRVPYPDTTNLYARVAGRTDEVIVVGAHLDHLGAGFPGADDNASGVAVLLALAEQLVARQGELERSVMFVWFGAEEQGLAGSRYFVADPPVPLDRIPAMVNLDMVGRPLFDHAWSRAPMYLIGIDRDRATGLVGARRFPGLRAIADAAFAAEGGELVAAEDLPPRIDAEVEAQSAGRSDSAAFEERGIPALFFGDGESRDYHSPRDTPAVLDEDVLARRGAAIARVVIALSTAPADAFARSERAPPRRKPPRGWYLPFGVVAGASSTPDAGGFVGGELSLVHLRPSSLTYAGVYVDAIRDAGAWRVSFGPELGRGWYGADAGYVVELDGGEVVDRGGAVRVFVGVSPLTVALRAGYLATRGGYAELGVALKFPLRL